MTPTKFENILNDIVTLVRNYEPYDVYFLDSSGNWRTEPGDISEIISSEVWYRIWLSLTVVRENESVETLLKPILNHKNTKDIIEKLSSTDGDKRCRIGELIKIFEVLYSIIEYRVYFMHCEKYVPDWNYKEKESQLLHFEKCRELKTRFCERIALPEAGEFFESVYEQLIGMKNEIFDKTCAVIYDEENIQRDLRNIESGNSMLLEQVYALLSSGINFDIGATATQSQALLRPLLQLLSKENLTISVGFQNEIVSLLGALKDSRCVKTLIAVLAKTKPEHTNLISNIIYALGNTGYREQSKYLRPILKLPDYLKNSQTDYLQPTFEMKTEAIWALGKLGLDARDSISDIAALKRSQDNHLRMSIAWAMGMIGVEEKLQFQGIDAEVLITLLDLLNSSDKKLFEEAIYSIKKLGLYDLITNINLKYIPGVTILSLKPSSIGLYELSETIYHLVTIKKPIVMAVTGDSGTGKTYFCEAIKNGFGNILKEEILYLMRDNPGHRAMFSKMIDRNFVKEYIEPNYANLGLHLDNDLAGADYFHNFVKINADKKLIILDGWLDELYFYQVLKVFYQYGFLDCIVNFRATYSTRRFNLETREGILERVKDCLRFVENPAIEDTEFYRNGDVFVYNLDNSISARLSQEEIDEVFSRQKIGVWGEHIRIGQFKRDLKESIIVKNALTPTTEDIQLQPAQHFNMITKEIDIETTHFLRTVNDTTEELNLIQTIDMEDIHPKVIVYHSPGVIAYHDGYGIAGILTGINNQNSFISLSDKIYDLCICNNMLCMAGFSGKLHAVDFDKKQTMYLETYIPEISCLASDRSNIIVSGHTDGTLRIWDIEKKNYTQLFGHNGMVVGLAVFKNNNVVSLSGDGELRLWNFQLSNVKVYKLQNLIKGAISSYLSSNTCLIVDRVWDVIKVTVLNLRENTTKTILTNENGLIQSFCTNMDGKIFIGFQDMDKDGSLMVIEPQGDSHYYKIIGKHAKTIASCITIGPQIITLGIDEGKTSLKIWASDKYATETREKLRMLKGVKKPFQYHSLLF